MCKRRARGFRDFVLVPTGRCGGVALAYDADESLLVRSAFHP
jgi:hypothetical protein